jgi:hypothetical protein
MSFLCWVGSEMSAYLGNVVVEPFRAQCSIRTSIIPVVVACHVLQDIMHSLRRDMREERFDEALMCQVGKVCNSVNKSTDWTWVKRLSLAFPAKVSTCWA